MENDSTLLAERVGQLQAENEQLLRDLEAARKQARTGYIVDRFLFGSLAVFLLGLAVIVGTLIYKSASAPAEITHCYISGAYRTLNKDTFTLIGVVEWGVDHDMGDFATFDDALAAGKRFGCIK